MEKKSPITFQAALKIPFDKDMLRPFFNKEMSSSAWANGRFNIDVHCTDTWMRDNWRGFWERCVKKPGGSRKRRQRYEMRRNFMAMLYLERIGQPIVWESVQPFQGKKRGISSVAVYELIGEQPSSADTEEPKTKVAKTDAVSIIENLASEAEVHGTEECAARPPPPAILQRALGIEGYKWFQEEEVAKLAADNVRLLEENTHLKSVDANSENILLHAEVLRQKERAEAAELQRNVHMKQWSTQYFDMNRKRLHSHPNVDELQGKTIIIAQTSADGLSGLYDRLSVVEKAHLPDWTADVCIACQKEIGCIPTIHSGFCKCPYHLHCFWAYFSSTGRCGSCRRKPDTSFYNYFCRSVHLPADGNYDTHTGARLVCNTFVETWQREQVEEQKVQTMKQNVRSALQRWAQEKGFNAWHTVGLTPLEVTRLDMVHQNICYDLLVSCDVDGVECFRSYANAMGEHDGRYRMLHHGLDKNLDVPDPASVHKTM